MQNLCLGGEKHGSLRRGLEGPSLGLQNARRPLGQRPGGVLSGEDHAWRAGVNMGFLPLHMGPKEA